MLIAATPAHAPALAEVHAAAFPPGERWDAAAMAQQLAMPGAFGWIAPAGGMILVRTAADEAEILTLAVAPALRRRGLARMLLEQAMDTARARGAAALFLEVAQGNVPALAAYDALQFAAVGRRPAYYPGGADALVLRRSLIAARGP